jgi:hypothetical protein
MITANLCIFAVSSPSNQRGFQDEMHGGVRIALLMMVSSEVVDAQRETVNFDFGWRFMLDKAKPQPVSVCGVCVCRRDTFFCRIHCGVGCGVSSRYPPHPLGIGALSVNAVSPPPRYI